MTASLRSDRNSPLSRIGWQWCSLLLHSPEALHESPRGRHSCCEGFTRKESLKIRLTCHSVLDSACSLSSLFDEAVSVPAEAEGRRFRSHATKLRRAAAGRTGKVFPPRRPIQVDSRGRPGFEPEDLHSAVSRVIDGQKFALGSSVHDMLEAASQESS